MTEEGLTRVSFLLGDLVSSSNETKRKRTPEELVDTLVSPDKKTKIMMSPDKKIQILSKVSPEKKIKSHSLDFNSFLKRVSSFRSPCWNRPETFSCGFSPLSPLQLARQGWEAVPDDDFLVRCSSCREPVYLSLPPVTSPVFRDMLNKQADRVESGHVEFCPWAVTPCPVTWTGVASSQNIGDFVTKAVGLSAFGTKLPYLGENVIDVRKVMREGVTYIVEKIDSVVDREVAETAALLSLCGWSVGQLEDTMTDIWTVRRIGLWNFISMEQEQDRREARLLAYQLSGCKDDIDDQAVENECKYFHPVKEHVSWHPLRLKRDEGKFGWEIIGNMIGKEKDLKGDQKKDTIIKPVDVLNKIRNLLDQW